MFLRNGLMEYGSIFGHGAYLGPDYTADYLRRSALNVLDAHGGQKSNSAMDLTVAEFKTNRYDPASDTLTFTQAQSAAYSQLTGYYRSFFNEPSTRYGLRPHAISERRDTDQLTAFFAWSGWVASALRPGRELLLYKQLAAGAAGWKSGHGECGGLERPVIDRFAGGDWSFVRGFWKMEFPGMAWARA